MLAAVGGVGIVGIVVIVLVVLSVLYFVRRACRTTFAAEHRPSQRRILCEQHFRSPGPSAHA